MKRIDSGAYISTFLKEEKQTNIYICVSLEKY
jgi:hypothetical protein